jgi:lauroyl/myristoyl acyltransferase
MSEPPAARREHSALLRQLAHFGARHGPRGFVRLSPPPIGAAFGLALPDVRARVVQNLRRIHGKRSAVREQLDALQTLANYASCLAEALANGRADLTPRVTVHGEERLQRALERGGVVLTTAHVGPWELTAQLLGRRLQANVVVVMEREPNARARQLHDRYRSESGVRVLHVGEHPTDALPLIAHLRGGGVAALQIDRAPPSGRTLPVSLFGQPFRVPEGPFRLASLSAASLLPVFARRLGFFDYELEIGESIELGRRASAEEVHGAAQRTISAMQAFVARSPTQWFHFGGG